MEREGLKQISDTGALEKIIDDVIAANPKQVEQYKGGKTTVISFLVGQVMKASRGQANVGRGDGSVQTEIGVDDMLKEGDQGSRYSSRTPTRARTSGSRSMKGKRVVLYFYPKADTPGCTVEACEFRDDIKAFAKKDAAVVGISPDKPAAQAKFKEKYDLPFTLLADEEKAAAAGLRRLERKEHVRQEGDGHRAHHLRDRPRRQDREDLQQGEGQGPRRGGAGRSVSMNLSKRCYAVMGLGYSAPWCVNAGFIAGDHTTLIVDSGGNSFAGQTVHGYASAARPGNELWAINTEMHFDHIGGNSYLRDQDVPIWGHAGIARTEAEFQGEIAEYNAAIPNAPRRELFEASVFFQGTEVTNPTRPIATDMTFDLGGCKVEVLLTPGHTPTNLSVWVPGDGVLYTGDCLINGYLPNLDAGGPSDWRIWLSSVDRLQALGAEAVVMGHGAVARGSEVQQVIDRVRMVLRGSIALGHSATSDGQH